MNGETKSALFFFGSMFPKRAFSLGFFLSLGCLRLFL